ncbi:MAG: hypothetical protein AB1545_15655 [Thermodesulfobacteriota bacterium]
MVTTFPVCAFPWSVGSFQTVDLISYAATNKAEKDGDVKDRFAAWPKYERECVMKPQVYVNLFALIQQKSCRFFGFCFIDDLESRADSIKNKIKDQQADFACKSLIVFWCPR